MWIHDGFIGSFNPLHNRFGIISTFFCRRRENIYSVSLCSTHFILTVTVDIAYKCWSEKKCLHMKWKLSFSLQFHHTLFGEKSNFIYRNFSFHFTICRRPSWDKATLMRFYRSNASVNSSCNSLIVCKRYVFNFSQNNIVSLFYVALKHIPLEFTRYG